MKKLTLLYIAAFLALTLGLLLSCAKKKGEVLEVYKEELYLWKLYIQLVFGTALLLGGFAFTTKRSISGHELAE